MKIFSFESRGVLVGWSVGLGLILLYISNIFSELPQVCTDLPCAHTSGFPWALKVSDFSSYKESEVIDTHFVLFNLAADLFFWIILVFIILFTIRHFRNKKASNSIKI